MGCTACACPSSKSCHERRSISNLFHCITRRILSGMPQFPSRDDGQVSSPSTRSAPVAVYLLPSASAAQGSVPPSKITAASSKNCRDSCGPPRWNFPFGDAQPSTDTRMRGCGRCVSSLGILGLAHLCRIQMMTQGCRC